MHASGLSLVVLAAGTLLYFFCFIMFIVVAFKRHILWGLAVLFVPLAGFVFLCMNWQRAKVAFIGLLIGGGMVGGAIASIPGASDAFWKQYQAQYALRHGKPLPSATADLNAQIQEHRQRLETLQATFAQDGVELTKQYQSLDAQRKALKPEDTAAITKFNEAAAAYQAKNVARKEMQTLIDSTQKELDSLLDTRSRQAANTASTTSNKRVIMYTTNHCPACELARQYFVKNGVHYEENNVEANRTAYEEFRKLGGKGVPLILVGDQKIEGFNVRTLDAALR